MHKYCVYKLRMRVKLGHFQTCDASKSSAYLHLLAAVIGEMNSTKMNWKIKYIHTHIYIHVFHTGRLEPEKAGMSRR